MNQHRDPPRWLESGALADELARELAAYGAQAPSAASKARMLTELGLEVAAPAASSLALVKLKLFIAGSVILAGVVGALQFARPAPAPTMRAPEVMHEAPARLAPLSRTVLAAQSDEEVEVQHAGRARARGRSASPTSELPAQHSVAAVVPAVPPAQAARPDVLAELTMLARARRALLNEPERALALSEEHARSYPHGTFDEEREVLAIESLVKLGRRDEARTRVRAFEARFPRSAQLAHLAKLIVGPSE